MMNAFRAISVVGMLTAVVSSAAVKYRAKKRREDFQSAFAWYLTDSLAAVSPNAKLSVSDNGDSGGTA